MVGSNLQGRKGKVGIPQGEGRKAGQKKQSRQRKNKGTVPNWEGREVSKVCVGNWEGTGTAQGNPNQTRYTGNQTA